MEMEENQEIQVEKFYKLGIDYLEKENSINALNMFQKCLELNSNCEKYYIGKIKAYIQLENITAAVAVTRKLLNIHPNSKKGSFLLLNLLFKQVKYAEAKEFAIRFRENAKKLTDKEDKKLLKLLGDLSFKLYQDSEGVEYYKKLVETDDQYPPKVLQKLGEYYYKNNQYHTAIKYLLKCYKKEKDEVSKEMQGRLLIMVKSFFYKHNFKKAWKYLQILFKSFEELSNEEVRSEAELITIKCRKKAMEKQEVLDHVKMIKEKIYNFEKMLLLEAEKTNFDLSALKDVVKASFSNDLIVIEDLENKIKVLCQNNFKDVHFEELEIFKAKIQFFNLVFTGRKKLIKMMDQQQNHFSEMQRLRQLNREQFNKGKLGSAPKYIKSFEEQTKKVIELGNSIKKELESFKKTIKNIYDTVLQYNQIPELTTDIEEVEEIKNKCVMENQLFEKLIKIKEHIISEDEKRSMDLMKKVKELSIYKMSCNFKNLHYFGEIRNRMKEGFGKIFRDGKIRFIGHFRNDKKEGFGKVIHDGKVETGFFHKDKKILDVMKVDSLDFSIGKILSVNDNFEVYTKNVKKETKLMFKMVLSREECKKVENNLQEVCKKLVDSHHQNFSKPTGYLKVGNISDNFTVFSIIHKTSGFLLLDSIKQKIQQQKKKRKVPPRNLALVVFQIAEGCRFLEENNIRFSAVSMDNIVVNQYNQIKILYVPCKTGKNLLDQFTELLMKINKITDCEESCIEATLEYIKTSPSFNDIISFIEKKSKVFESPKK